MSHIMDFSGKNRVVDFFDLYSAPKTQEQIDSFSSELLDENSKKLRAANAITVSTFAILFVISLIFVFIKKENYTINSSLFVINTFCWVSAFLFLLYQSPSSSKLIYDEFLIKTYMGKISDLYHMSERNGTILTINSMLSNETLRGYLEAVSAQGRELIEAEFEILFESYTKTEEYLQEQKLAKELLIFNGDSDGEDKYEG